MPDTRTPDRTPTATELATLEGRLRGLVVADRAPVLDGADVTYLSVAAPVGTLTLALADRTLVASSYADEDELARRLAMAVSPRVLRAAGAAVGRFDAVRSGLDAFFEGRARRVDVPVDLALAGGFARAVLEALDTVPYGATTTYGALAQVVGRPGAARAVGQALGANPVCVVVPCHRVVAAHGTGGYAGGAAAKRLLLELEAAHPEDLPA